MGLILLFKYTIDIALGDEVIEWNGIPLRGKTHQEVANVIAESKHELNVEIIVSRTIGSRKSAQTTWKHPVTQIGMIAKQFSPKVVNAIDVLFSIVRSSLWRYIELLLYFKIHKHTKFLL